jgi:hypothetical protein
MDPIRESFIARQARLRSFCTTVGSNKKGIRAVVVTTSGDLCSVESVGLNWNYAMAIGHHTGNGSPSRLRTAESLVMPTVQWRLVAIPTPRIDQIFIYQIIISVIC